MARTQTSGWTKMQDPPKLTSRQWNVVGLLGITFVVMALLQAISFSDFKDWLNSIGLGAPETAAVLIIILELLAAVSMFKVKLPGIVRMLSMLSAIFIGGFWFFQNLRLVAETQSGQLQSSGFFGSYLNQSPGWWTVLETSIFLLWVVYALKLTWPKSK